MQANRTISLSLAIAFLIIATGNVEARGYDPISPPEFDRRSLLNGMEILFLPASKGEAPFLLMIKNGAAFDPVTKWGATYLTAWMLVRQTRNQFGVPIQQNLKALDVGLEFRVEWDAIYFWGTVPLERLSDALGLLAEMLVRPEFDESTFAELRGQLLEEVKLRRHQVEDATQELFLHEVFRENPYSHPVKGTADTLENLSITDVKIQYRKLFIPNQTQLALHYSGDWNALFTTLSRQWGSWVHQDPLPFTFRPAPEMGERRILLLDFPSEDALFRWGTLAVEMGSGDYYVLKILEQYLTLSLPHWAREVASENQIRGSCKLHASVLPGYLQLNVQAEPEKLIDYFKQFEHLMNEFQEGKVNNARFDEARQLVYVELVTSLKMGSLSRLHRLLDTTLYNLGINFITHYGTRLSRITPEYFQRIAREYLSPERFVLIVAGPEDKLEPPLRELGGKFEVRDSSSLR